MAGEAARRLKQEQEDVVFDFSKPLIHLGEQIRKNYATRLANPDDPEPAPGEPDTRAKSVRPDLVVPRAVSVLIVRAVRAAFPVDPRTGAGGMTRKDSKFWAAWQEDLDAMEDEERIATTMPRGQAEWLRKVLEDEKLSLDPGFAQSREAVIEYLGSLRPPLVAVGASEDEPIPV